MQRDYLESFAGAGLPGLFEPEKEGSWRGFSPNYLEVRAAGGDLHNRVLPVRIERAGPGFLTGSITDGECIL
jgi:hypothetical protein